MAGFPEESKPLASGVVDDDEVVVEREWMATLQQHSTADGWWLMMYIFFGLLMMARRSSSTSHHQQQQHEQGFPVLERENENFWNNAFPVNFPENIVDFLPISLRCLRILCFSKLFLILFASTVKEKKKMWIRKNIPKNHVFYINDISFKTGIWANPTLNPSRNMQAKNYSSEKNHSGIVEVVDGDI